MICGHVTAVETNHQIPKDATNSVFIIFSKTILYLKTLLIKIFIILLAFASKIGNGIGDTPPELKIGNNKFFNKKVKFLNCLIAFWNTWIILCPWIC